MKVVMHTTTNFDGVKFKDQEYNIPEDVAIRWHNNGIATIVESEEEEETPKRKKKRG